MFIIILFLLIFVLISLAKKNKEKFGGIKLEYIKSGTVSFDDKLFNDVTMYKSDMKDLQKAGIYECLEKCKGTCVEYGVTGNAFCFPK
jgi:glutamate formiminotransferase